MSRNYQFDENNYRNGNMPYQQQQVLAMRLGMNGQNQQLQGQQLQTQQLQGQQLTNQQLQNQQLQNQQLNNQQLANQQLQNQQLQNQPLGQNQQLGHLGGQLGQNQGHNQNQNPNVNQHMGQMQNNLPHVQVPLPNLMNQPQMQTGYQQSGGLHYQNQVHPAYYQQYRLPQQQSQQQQQQQQTPQQAPQQQTQQVQQGHQQQQKTYIGGRGQGGGQGDDENLRSRFIENEIIKTFPNKQDLVQYIKTTLNDEEGCRIVINSSKPKAIYFQCERSGSFRTTVKDSSKRQRVAYTKRNKCGYRLVANLYPPEKDKRRLSKPDGKDDLGGPGEQFDEKLLNHLDGNEMWILRMINPHHNHPSDPPSLSKKKKLKNSRILVEKPLPKPPNYNPLPYSQGTSRQVAEQQLTQRKLHEDHGANQPQRDFNIPYQGDATHAQGQLPPQQMQQQMLQQQDLQDPDVLAAISNNVNNLGGLNGLNNMNLPNLNLNSVNSENIDPAVQDEHIR